jgi:8-oxo-dGTP pyrophosphatase MutT (NUDIX family)
LTDTAELRALLGGYQPGRVPVDLSQDDYSDVTHDLTPASVLVGIVDHASEPNLLMTVRNERMKKHAGQVAFPGGRADPGETAIETALREAKEEVALPPGSVDVIGTLDDYRTGTGYRITPIVGVVPPGLNYRAHEPEVDEIFEVPLRHALDLANHREDAAVWQGRERCYFTIDWQPQRIWGATAGIIVNLSRTLAALR